MHAHIARPHAPPSALDPLSPAMLAVLRRAACGEDLHPARQHPRQVPAWRFDWRDELIPDGTVRGLIARGFMATEEDEYGVRAFATRAGLTEIRWTDTGAEAGDL